MCANIGVVGFMEVEMSHKIGEGTMFFLGEGFKRGMLREDLSVEIKIGMFEEIVVPFLLYGCKAR